MLIFNGVLQVTEISENYMKFNQIDLITAILIQLLS